MPSRALPVFLSVFSAAFAVLYVLAMDHNWAALTYHPRPAEWGWGVEPPRNGPAMYWYGWMTTAGAGALAVAALALAAARTVPASLWFRLGWLAPAGAIVVALYLMSPFFLR
jgi:hypothetical protein